MRTSNKEPDVLALAAQDASQQPPRTRERACAVVPSASNQAAAKVFLKLFGELINNNNASIDPSCIGNSIFAVNKKIELIFNKCDTLSPSEVLRKIFSALTTSYFGIGIPPESNFDSHRQNKRQEAEIFIGILEKIKNGEPVTKKALSARIGVRIKICPAIERFLSETKDLVPHQSRAIKIKSIKELYGGESSKKPASDPHERATTANTSAPKDTYSVYAPSKISDEESDGSPSFPSLPSSDIQWPLSNVPKRKRNVPKRKRSERCCEEIPKQEDSASTERQIQQEDSASTERQIQKERRKSRNPTATY